MSPVFAHGRLRLYLLKLLDEAPRHGYEVIRLLEERFQGLYAPSAGTVYPRLAKLEAEGLVTHASEGGRKVYSITDAGRAELAGRGAELTDLEREIRDSVSELAAEIRDDVRGAAGRVRSEMRAAAGQTRKAEGSSFADAKEELRRAKQEWKEQARQAKAEAQSARHQAKEFQRIAQQVQEEVQDRFSRGDWPKGVWEGLSDITAQLGGLVAGTTHPKAAAEAAGSFGGGRATGEAGGAASADAADEAAQAPEWARDTEGSGDPGRDLDRLLDRFRDEIRDAARDHGVTGDQLAETRRHLSTAAVRITDVLNPRRES
ncbi:Transcriptional regulator, PadR family [Streptomyces venezuelae]|uniref:helix-turn-helix transcriptional regulator n=1 Tax=Streptomyces gardneri TaxID=66892 RepID=UPI0006BC0E7F|nr:helix-turn-helix transcriptional regulator [Streptomyces gardneri]ALO10990.1 Transcriptional regulator, PadR family [Streptomyces venezuelae]QPK47936.1 transcriptional regulator [Streptomyces gardneri]WRK39392.1 helix-turn-helix transcriptional regulator [Streptomyces venezuelae]CUM38507.1 Transcriptional regulator, PadR family [Streptomyces venezuelae]